ncbi:MAG: hypothetical protein JWO51_100 [Rhodospirillales bacterium]|nr:hypothetical protein [Rhodospirillales bacterium]
MPEREFDDGHYWVQLQSDSDPEVALLDCGVWRLHGIEEPHETGDFYRIGRRVEFPEDAFEGSHANVVDLPLIRQ